MPAPQGVKSEISGVGQLEGGKVMRLCLSQHGPCRPPTHSVKGWLQVLVHHSPGHLTTRPVPFGVWPSSSTLLSHQETKWLGLGEQANKQKPSEMNHSQGQTARCQTRHQQVSLTGPPCPTKRDTLGDLQGFPTITTSTFHKTEMLRNH